MKRFAVIKLQGSQFIVSENEQFEVNRLDMPQGAEFDITEVLLTQDGENVSVGQPILDKAKVKMQVVEHKRGEKIEIRTFKSKSRTRKHNGHRQELTVVRVLNIEV